ncbi:MAG: type I DNA topoisomerase [Fimbriimonadaceae bacterium]|nr:type I DNA topoisomerase [Fimbriimonadaceae bacterium]QYK56934.1 MAG: type I DNA topoisomerase [Fimbriimonadaceae bacterium]
MTKSLVIVESPAKAKTIANFLGPGYDVVASYGHVRDLPESADDIPEEFKKKKWAKLGVNVEGEYEPLYVVPGDKRRRVDELKRSAKGIERLLLATDEDREGESISWHVLQILKPAKKVKVERIVFHEITPEAIRAALDSPRSIDEALVRAQETRRILDRLYGYTLSPLLWRKVAKGLSAGRVQSVAVRLIVMRERERRDFVVVDYSGIEAKLGAAEGEFSARLARIEGAPVADGQSFSPRGELVERNARWLLQEEAETRVSRLERAAPWTVTKLETNPGVENPPPPFMTSTLQQEANRKLGFAARRTMQIAQQLYEGIDIGGERVGLITYMRTDSLSLAERAVSEARTVIADLYGKEYVPAKPRQYKSKAKNAQEAHEAIRPTDLGRRPQDVQRHLDADQYKLYELIWKRTLACQMKQAEVERTRVEVEVEDDGQTLTFVASGKRIVFPGFLRVYVEGADDPEAELGDRERILPAMRQGEALAAKAVTATSHQTKPPARYTEASLVQKLEQEGVGRPSTYATIIGTVQDRGYVFRRAKELVPTWTAFAVTSLLEENFQQLVDTSFTANMEEQLDEIADGRRSPVQHLRKFYEGEGDEAGLETQVESKAKEIPFPVMPLGDDIVVRIGRNGPFLQRGEGGTGNTASIPEEMPPADLSLDEAKRLIENQAQGPAAIAVDPGSGRCVFFKKGRFGAYLEVDQSEDERAGGATPRRVTLPPGMDGGQLSDEDVAELLKFPKELGNHPESGEPVVLAIGRYGAYLSSGEKRANVGDWREARSLALAEALERLNAPRKAWGSGGTAAKSEPIKSFGKLEGFEGEVRVLPGRYGPYVTDGKTNATVPKGTDPEKLTVEQAMELLRARQAAGPTKKKRFVRRKKS